MCKPLLLPTPQTSLWLTLSPLSRASHSLWVLGLVAHGSWLTWNHKAFRVSLVCDWIWSGLTTFPTVGPGSPWKFLKFFCVPPKSPKNWGLGINYICIQYILSCPDLVKCRNAYQQTRIFCSKFDPWEFMRFISLLGFFFRQKADCWSD